MSRVGQIDLVASFGSDSKNRSWAALGFSLGGSFWSRGPEQPLEQKRYEGRGRVIPIYSHGKVRECISRCICMCIYIYIYICVCVSVCVLLEFVDGRVVFCPHSVGFEHPSRLEGFWLDKAVQIRRNGRSHKFCFPFRAPFLGGYHYTMVLDSAAGSVSVPRGTAWPQATDRMSLRREAPTSNRQPPQIPLCVS